jgi:hypothetical protein
MKIKKPFFKKRAFFLKLVILNSVLIKYTAFQNLALRLCEQLFHTKTQNRYA